MSEQQTKNICSKPDHLYKRYWCKECETHHYKDTPLGKKHKEFKVNRYFCLQCGWTHVATHGELFENHLKHMGAEIEFFGKACSLKCRFYRSMGIRLSSKDAKLIDRIKKEKRMKGWYYKGTEEDFKIFAILTKYIIKERKIPYPFMLIQDYNIYDLKIGDNNQIEEIMVSERDQMELRMKIYLICKKIILKEFPDDLKDMLDRIELEMNEIVKFYAKNVFNLRVVPIKCDNCKEEIDARVERIRFYPEFLDLFDLEFIPKFKHKYNCYY